MCYIGKATKIFIVAVIVITGLVFGFGLISRNFHPKSRKCSGEDCSFSDYSPPPLQDPFASVPDPNASNPSDPIVSSNASPPPPPPPSVSLNDQSPPPPSTIPVSVVTPPAAVTAPPPQAVQVAPGPERLGGAACCPPPLPVRVIVRLYLLLLSSLFI